MTLVYQSAWMNVWQQLTSSISSYSTSNNFKGSHSYSYKIKTIRTILYQQASTFLATLHNLIHSGLSWQYVFKWICSSMNKYGTSIYSVQLKVRDFLSSSCLIEMRGFLFSLLLLNLLRVISAKRTPYCKSSYVIWSVIFYTSQKCNLCELLFFARIVNNNGSGFRLRERERATSCNLPLKKVYSCWGNLLN